MFRIPRQLIKKVLNLTGLDIVRISQRPLHQLLGLKNLSIKTIIDIGANKGQFARYISTIFPDAHIYCFEPLPKPYMELNRWAGRQKNGKVKTFNIALGATEEKIKMYYHVEHSPSSSFLQSTEVCEKLYPFTKKQTSITVQATTLDKVFANLSEPIAPEILIKLDVQGYEAHVLKGGEKTFKKAKVSILEVGLDELYKNQSSFNDISSLLHNLGFHYAGNLEQVYANDGHIVYIDALFIK
jgi:FkbM family methyltransferase